MGSIPDAEQRRATEADRAWQCKDLERLCELYAEQIEADAQNVALNHGLAWGLPELRECGRHSVYELAKDPRLEQLSLRFSKVAPGYIRNKIREAGESMRAQEEVEGSKRPPPSDECIREALEIFSVGQWARLIAKFREEDAEILGSYLEANIGELELSLDQTQPSRLKYRHIAAYAVKHRIVLALSQPRAKWVSVSGPEQAKYLREFFRGAPNQEDAPRPSKGPKDRSFAEMGSYRAIAEALNQRATNKVYGKKVKRWLDRMEETPFAEFDGNLHDYLMYISDPAAYERLRHRREQAGE